MEDIFTYVIVFGLLILFTSLYLFRKDKKRSFILSQQQLGKYLLTVREVKQNKKILSLILELNENTDPSRFFIELIDSRRERETRKLIDFLNDNTKPTASGLHLDYEPFKEIIENLHKKGITFRFGYELNSSTKIKSHELTFSKHWNVYKVDSGRYN